MNLVLSYALNALWQVPLAATAGWLISRLGRRAHPQTLHRWWVATLLLAMMMPFAGLSRGWVIASAHGEAKGVRLLAAGEEAPTGHHLLSHGVLALPHVWVLGLVCLYFLLILFAAMRLVIGFIKTQRLARSAGSVEMAAGQLQVWQRCQSVFQLTGVVLRISDEIAGPAVIGWRPAILLLPASFLLATEGDELLAALAHECAHIARRDYLFNLLYECAALPIAWHPITAMLRAQLAQTREEACDRMVAEMVMPPTLYAGALLRLASRIPAPLQGLNIHAVGIFDANILEKRIMNLKTKRIALSSMKKLALASAAIAVAGSCAVSALALTMEVDQAQSLSVAQAEKDQIYKVGGNVSAPTLVYSVDPEYTEEARRAKYQGVCVVQIVVDAHGQVQRTKVIRALGMGLDKKAIQSVKQYRFTPAMRNGTPVQVALNIEVNFRVY